MWFLKFLVVSTKVNVIFTSRFSAHSRSTRCYLCFNRIPTIFDIIECFELAMSDAVKHGLPTLSRYRYADYLYSKSWFIRKIKLVS